MADELIYHYTSAAGLKGIIQDGVIHCTNNLFLNDSQEYHYTFKLIKGTLKKIFDTENVETEIKESAMKIVEIAEEILLKSAEQGKLAPYVVSFSEAADQLSQWRGYCDYGGYSLGFNKHEVLQSQKKVNNFHRAVEYPSDNDFDNQNLHSSVKEFLKAVKESTSLHSEQEDPSNGIVTPILKHSEESILTAFCVVLFYMMPFYKHPSFREEKEFRISLLNKMTDKIDYKTRGNILVPFKKLKLDLQKLLQVVYIGPCNHPDQAKLGLRLLLESKSLAHVKIIDSKIPYRNMG